ncbi:MAG TPA: sensor domain-containing diguanylate cyclase [Desulfobacterales bacterium]|nr:sensor domain-containing diguanylate cyclase [Desulfobacterales bacterium]
MRLKGKLVLGFTSVVFASLAILGGIIYYTFAQGIQKDTRQILTLQTRQTAMAVHNALHYQINDIVIAISPSINRLRRNQALDAVALENLRAITDKVPLIKSLYLYRNSTAAVIPLSTRRNAPWLIDNLKNLKNSAPGKSSFWFHSHNHLYLALALTAFNNKNSKKDQNILVAEINEPALSEFINSLTTIKGSVLYLSQGGKLLIPPISTTGRGGKFKPPEFSRIQAALTKGGILENQGRIYQPKPQLFSSRISILIPRSFYQSRLSILRDRIITALLIVAWCAIWIIFIIAQRIVRPVQRLNKLTRDTIAFNYTSELEIKPSDDEIGDLSLNFENMRLKIKDLVTKDQLTHVFNRCFLMHIFELALLKALRLEETLSCIMIDIDYFKKVNNTFGHQAGDEVLAMVGKILLQHTRDYDTPARYGGEKFIFILPDTTIDTAGKIAERIRRAMEQQTVHIEGQRINCTLSLGIAELDKHTANTTEQIISHASTALRRAKDNGRNQISIFVSAS